MNITELLHRRYTTKAYDPSKKIPENDLNQLLECLRLSPSSVNAQPWHFTVASTAEGKQKIAKSMEGVYAFNLPRVLDASHVVVLSASVFPNQHHLNDLLAQEDKDGRFISEEAKQGWHQGRSYFVDWNIYTQKNVVGWTQKQVYLAMGFLLFGAAALKIDATPIEGFDSGKLDSELELNRKGFTSSVLVSLGYHAKDDFNANLPKSRLAREKIFDFI